MQISRKLGLLAASALASTMSLMSASQALANAPHGVWLDHQGRAAIEISDCGCKL